MNLSDSYNSYSYISNSYANSNLSVDDDSISNIDNVSNIDNNHLIELLTNYSDISYSDNDTLFEDNEYELSNTHHNDYYDDKEYYHGGFTNDDFSDDDFSDNELLDGFGNSKVQIQFRKNSEDSLSDSDSDLFLNYNFIKQFNDSTKSLNHLRNSNLSELSLNDIEGSYSSSDKSYSDSDSDCSILSIISNEKLLQPTTKKHNFLYNLFTKICINSKIKKGGRKNKTNSINNDVEKNKNSNMKLTFSNNMDELLQEVI